MRAVLLLTFSLLMTTVNVAEAACWVTSNPQVDQQTAAGRFYVQVDGGASPGAFVYQEINGIPGLQRRDANVGDQSCGFPDQLVAGANA